MHVGHEINFKGLILLMKRKQTRGGSSAIKLPEQKRPHLIFLLRVLSLRTFLDKLQI